MDSTTLERILKELFRQVPPQYYHTQSYYTQPVGGNVADGLFAIAAAINALVEELRKAREQDET